jgi:hypothetical protein
MQFLLAGAGPSISPLLGWARLAIWVNTYMAHNDKQYGISGYDARVYIVFTMQADHDIYQ